MQEDEPLNPAERELADALRGLEPTPPAASERQLWYRAGVAAGRRRANGWRAATAAMGVAVAVLLARGRAAVPVAAERIVYVRQTVPAPATTVVAADTPDFSAAYLRLRDAVAEHGLDGLPPASTAGSGPGLPASRGRPPELYGENGLYDWLPPGQKGSL